MPKILLLLFLTVSTLLSSQMGTVTGLDPNGDGFLSLRKKPKSTEIGRLYNGDKVKIFKRSGKYYKIKDIKSGKTGWAHSNWIRKTQRSSSSTSHTSKKGFVYGLDPNGDGFLSIRSKPKGRKIGNLYNGDSITILAKRGKWYKVKTASSGQVGWAHGNWIRKIEEMPFKAYVAQQKKILKKSSSYSDQQQINNQRMKEGFNALNRQLNQMNSNMAKRSYYTPSNNSYPSNNRQRSPGSSSGYRGDSGAKYQYDSSKYEDQIRYQYDYNAQHRDRMYKDYSGDRNRDTSGGQYGTGIYGQ